LRQGKRQGADACGVPSGSLQHEARKKATSAGGWHKEVLVFGADGRQAPATSAKEAANSSNNVFIS
jgi:hypothetical protein